MKRSAIRSFWDCYHALPKGVQKLAFKQYRLVRQIKTMNSLRVIAPYKWEDMWVFDDPSVGLDKEPFVSGADSMIDLLTSDIPNADNGFKMIFSDQPFPGFTVHLSWRRPEHGGNWYFSDSFQMEGWLCPALFKYFESAPKDIYVKAEPKKK